MSKVIVIGRNYTSRLGMIRAVGQAGCDVVVIQTNGTVKDIDSYSKYVKKHFFAREPNRKLLIDTILSLAETDEKVIIIPVDDYAASTIDENIDKLKERFLFPNAEMQPGAVNRLMDKNLQKELAAKAGFNVAQAWVVNVKDGHFEIPSDIKYPCFPKPQVSFTGNKTCMKRCESAQELNRILKEFVTKFPNCSILVEEFKVIEHEYGVLGFCDKDTIVAPGFVDKLMIGDGHHKGVTKLGEVTPLNKRKELYQTVQIFLQSIHLTGLCDIDLYENEGKIYFNELNLRFGAFGYSILCAGANLPELFIKTMKGETISPGTIKVNEKVVCLSEKVNFEDYVEGYYDREEYNRIYAMADSYFLADEQDPMPWLLFKKTMPSLIFKRNTKMFIKALIGKKYVHKIKKFLGRK